jgi:GNAT superfamily N-acetyltransferase
MSAKIEVKKVTNEKMKMEFIMLPWKAEIYKYDLAWVPPIIKDQKHFLDPEQGYFFEHGEAQLFIAYKDGKPAGRISAHVYSRYEEKYDRDTGFFGFYESIDDLALSRTLFEAAREWLRTKGKKKMNGPQSFSVYDPIGFDVINNGRMPVIGMCHYAHWYEKHALAFGFEKQMDWYCFMVKKDGIDWEPMFKIREQLAEKTDIKFVTMKKRDIPKRAEQVKYILNTAWEGNEGHLALTDKQFDMIFNEIKMAIIPELAIFAEKDGKTVGFIFSIPDANPGFAGLNGRLYPWRIPQLIWKLKTTRTLRTILMGVLPEHRGQDIDQILILMTMEIGIAMGYIQSDCSLVVETNKKMIGALKFANSDLYKGYRVYQLNI